jgi:ribose transport system substrate-binding protein
MVRNIRFDLQIGGIGAAVLLTVSLAACSSSPSAGTELSVASADVVSGATARVDQYFANDRADFDLPAISVPDALEGKTVMFLSAGLASAAGTAALKALKSIQPEVGFNLRTFDGQFTMSTYQEGMRQAVAQDVDVLIMHSVDCAGNEAALRAVRDAGIKIVPFQSVDCNEADPNAEPLFDAQPLFPLSDGRSGTAIDWWTAVGAAQADYLISKHDGDVKVIQFDVPDFAVVAALGQGFRDRLAECATCEILETTNVRVADFGPGLQEKAELAILRHPEANAIQVPYDDLLTVGVTAAIMGSGRADSLVTLAGSGFETSLDLIREGRGLDGGYVQDYSWDAYSAVDAALRLSGGQEAAVNGIPVTFYDGDHNMPKSGAFEPAIDFRIVFEEAWGVS